MQKDNLNPEEVKEPLKELMKELDSWNLFPFSNVHGSNEPKKRGLGGLPGQFGKTASLSGLGTSSDDPLKFPGQKVAWDCVDARLPDFQTFRRPFSHQKLPFLSPTLTFDPSKPKKNASS